MQFSIPIYSLTGTYGCKQYLEASNSRKNNEILDFSFIDIHNACPNCSLPGCALWKGYYTRKFFCSKLEFNGRIWIRKGFCKTKKINFSMLPDFCVPDLRWSIFVFFHLLNLKGLSFFSSLDLDISFSTLYWIGSLLVKLLRINSHLYLQHPPKTNSTCELKSFSLESIKKLPLNPEFNWNKQIIPSSNSPPH